MFGILVKLSVHQYQFYDYWVTRSLDMTVQRLATEPVFAKTLKVWGGHISNTTGPIGLKFWIWCCGFPNNMYTKFN